VTEHFDFVWRSLRRLGVARADADDAAQEVFLVLTRRLNDLEQDRERAFLFATSLRVASTRRRSARRKPEATLDEFEELPAMGLDPEELAELSNARALLQDILNEMDLEFRSVFVLAELEELSAPEIADLLDIPLGTVSSRLRAARETFRGAVRRLAQQEVFKGRRR
jgi:RNA polymerase sigma-70 factor (ECF subfamily)